jgi:hypothetical protein
MAVADCGCGLVAVVRVGWRKVQPCRPLMSTLLFPTKRNLRLRLAKPQSGVSSLRSHSVLLVSKTAARARGAECRTLDMIKMTEVRPTGAGSHAD